MELPAEQKRRYTLAEYFEMEERSPEKHEYAQGAITLMAGGSRDHSLIATNFLGELRARLKGKPCRVYGSDLRIRIPRFAFYMYPDGSVICGPERLDPDDPGRGSVTNPRLILEVLSPSTEAYDRGEKFRRYRQLESFEEYVLVSQDMAQVESLWRREDGTWLFMTASGLDAALTLRSLGVDLPLSEIYAGVAFPPVDAPPDIEPHE